MRLVLDTNVIISAALWDGTPRQVLEAAHNKHTLCFSLVTLDEIDRVFHYPKLAERLAQLSFSSEEFIKQLLEDATLVSETPEVKLITEDPDDNQFLACAEACNAKLIVSGDTHILALKKFKGISIVPPKTALKQL